ncbi:MAG: hypothetical protein K1000chlam4_00165 [Chlamydiae bacterium]|nr:hypothetical protein [Chlamydiota bacterium]
MKPDEIKSTTPPPSPIYKAKEDAKVTAVALMVIALLLGGTGLILMGIQTMPETMHLGLGVFLFFGGGQMVFMGAGQFMAAIGFATYAIFKKPNPVHS